MKTLFSISGALIIIALPDILSTPPLIQMFEMPEALILFAVGFALTGLARIGRTLTMKR